VDVSTTRCVYDDTPLNCINTDPVLREKYDRLEQMAAGGMGIIFKAHDIAHDQIVAIKTMHLHVMTVRTVERFRVEGKMTARLSHPNIVVIHDYGIAASGQPYLVMDYLAGESLGELLQREATLSSSLFFSIFSQVCEALAHAHERSILHRDIKPGNIMLTPNQSGIGSGRDARAPGEFHVTVLDFGIARLLDDEEYEAQKMTQTGDIIGSPAYMSPEQARGGKVDARADVYSLGCVMYEALCGVPPFFGKSSLETMLMHKTDGLLPMSEASLGKKVDPELEKFVSRLLEKNPDHRYQTMSEIKRDLLLLKDGRSIAKGSTEPTKSVGLSRTAKIAIVTASTLAASGIIIFAIAHNFWQQPAPLDAVPASTLQTDDHVDSFYDKNEIQRTITRCLQVHDANLDLTGVNMPVTNEDLSQLKGASFLTHISINHGTINDDGLQALRNLPLEELRLESTKVKNLSAIKELKTLSQLELQGSPIDASGIKIIGHLTGLEHLILSQTPVRDQDLKYLYALKNLRTLELSDCPNITQPAVQQLRETLNQCEISAEVAATKNIPDRLKQEVSEAELGKALAKVGQYEKASVAFQKAIAKMRADPTPNWIFLSGALGYLGDCQGNLHHYKQATDSRQEELKMQLEKAPLQPEVPRSCGHTATLYEKWNLASPSKTALKSAADLRLKSEEVTAKLEGEEESLAARPANLAALAHDYMSLRDYKKAAQTYMQFADFGLPTTLLRKMADALGDEANNNKSSFARAIALRTDAERLFAKPEFKGSTIYELLHAQNLECLGADLMPDYDQALPLLDQAALRYANSKLVLSADFLANLEKTADYERAKNAAKSLSLYKTVETAYNDVGRAADSTRLHKKIALLAQK